MPGTLTADFSKLIGGPATGQVYLEAVDVQTGVPIPEIVDTAGDVVYTGAQTVAVGNGKLSVTLPAGNDPGLSVSGFVYRVSPLLDSGYLTPKILDIAAGATTDFSDAFDPSGLVTTYAALVNDAQVAAAAADASADQAGASATDAHASALSAADSRDQAALSASGAATSAGQADSARQAASDSASSASDSASSAGDSADAAGSSADAAAGSVTTAGSSAGAAASSASAAAGSASSAAAALSTLETSDIPAALAAARDRSTHTGTQLAVTISDFLEAVQDAIAQTLVSGANLTLSYDDPSGLITINASGGDSEVIRDAIGAAIVGTNGITVAVNDPGDTITIGLGSVTIAQVTGLQAALDSKAPSSNPTFTGPLTLTSQADPSPPAAGQLALYSKIISGRSMVKQIGPAGLHTPLQPGLFGNMVVMIGTGNGATLSNMGGSSSNQGTITHPAKAQTSPYMANSVSAGTAGAVAGFGGASTQWQIGVAAGGPSSGFFYSARLAFPDASYDTTGGAGTGSRIAVGLTAATLAAVMAADSPSNNFAGFLRRSTDTLATEANWQFASKSGSGTISLTDTGMPFVVGHVYDFYIYCRPMGTQIQWRIDDLTAGTTQEGTMTAGNSLPAGGAAMRMGALVYSVDAVARNIRMNRIYCESDV